MSTQQTITEAEIQFLTNSLLEKTQLLCNEYSVIGTGFIESFERVCAEIGGSFNKAIKDAVKVRERLEKEVLSQQKRAYYLVELLWEPTDAFFEVN